MATPQRPGDVAPYVDDERPATVAQLRSTRRWLAVTAVWAVAATALAVLAFLEANEDDDAARTQAAGELGRVQRDLNERIDELESRIDELPASEDVSNLDDRLGELEGRVDQVQSGNERLSGRVDDLETRVEELEQSSAEQPTETAP
jgi:septal ring factor EnvC (AmiA/AmiB activator)